MFWLRVFAVWLVMMSVEFIHGAMRTVFLGPHLGDFLARQVSVFTGSLLILFIVCLLIRWIRAAGTPPLIAMGLIWLALTVSFELGLGHYAFGRSWAGLASDYNILHGGLLPVGLAVLTFSPLIAAKWRGVEKVQD